MSPDQWIVDRLIKLFRLRYGQTLYREFLNWQRLYEAERITYLLSQLAACGNDITIRQGANILAPENVYLGNHIGIGYYSLLRGQGGITIEDFTVIGDNVIIATAGHPPGELYFNNTWQKPVILKQNVWLGANVLVMPGVTIGENAAVGAGAVVTSDIPANTVAVGVPARVIHQLEIQEQILEQRKAEVRQVRANR